jgi:hypothetical protein
MEKGKLTMTRRGLIVATVTCGLLALGGCGRPAPAVIGSVKAPTKPKVASPAPPKAATVAAKPPEPPKPKARIRPESATLEPGDPGIQFLVDEPGDHGGRIDLTGAVTWQAVPAGLVSIEPTGYLRPTGTGRVTVKALRDGKALATSEIDIQGAEERPWTFGTDIVPLFTRYGCNTGGCHGRADGQNGFHLSLFGYDHEGDFQAVTREANGRRILPLDPEHSLLLDKATGRVPHGGGQRFAPGSEPYRTFLGWLQAGAPERRGKTHGALVDLHVEPLDVRLDAPGPLQLRVVAKYADGHERDVTRLAKIAANDDSAASVDEKGSALLKRRAEVDLVVRYQSNVVATRVATLINPDLKFDFAKVPHRNFVDDELFKRLESLKVPPSAPANDAAFLRRATLDLTAQQPEPSDVREFIKDKDPEKRAKLIDRLLASREFVNFWNIKLGDMLQISQARFNNGAGPYAKWLHDRLSQNAPWDVMVRELLTSLGNPFDMNQGSVNYALDDPDPKVRAERTAQRFLGLRVRCAQCHDHPFDVWTQDDYYGLAAFFAKTSSGPPRPGMMGRTVVKVDEKGQVEHLRTKKPAQPRLPKGEALKLEESEDPRKKLADWITRLDNPYFARAMANWTWAQLFGKGLADPADDLSRANPPVHPELLDALAKHFAEHKFDLRELVRTIASSEAYGLSSASVAENERDTRLFSHHLPRPLTAHQMADALARVTNVPDRYGQGRVIRKAIEVPDPGTASAVLDAFGRCPRTNGCSSVSTPTLSLRQALLLIGGDAIEGKVSSLNGYLSEALELNQAPDELVQNLYFRTLCRPPTEEELSHWTGVLKGSSNQRDTVEDLFWALLNSREFAFNH